MTFLAVSESASLHPGDALPHPAGFEIPPLLFWILSVVTAGLVVWIACDLRRGAAPQRNVGPEPAEAEADEKAGPEPLVIGRPRAGRSRRVTLPDETPVDAESLAITPVRAEPMRVWLNPARLLVATLGIGLGIVATERARQVQALASLVRSDNAAQVSRLALAFAVLLLLGGSVAIFAPRVAALLLAVDGVLAIFLSVVPDLANRLRWWDVGYVLQPWESLRWWAGGCAALALLAWFSASYQPQRRR